MTPYYKVTPPVLMPGGITIISLPDYICPECGRFWKFNFPEEDVFLDPEKDVILVDHAGNGRVQKCPNCAERIGKRKE